MKSFSQFSGHSGSCSCASCVFRKKSNKPSAQQLMQGASEIDKLYYGKYLPLRERKLLEKLIRTRDFYDDVRDQLLSSSGSSDLTSEYRGERRDDVSTKSSAVRKMVDIVERGKNSCCSCCSCETLQKIREHMKKNKDKQHPCVHGHLVKCEDIAKYCAEAAKRGRKRRKKLSTKISSSIGAARLKIKENLSEPAMRKSKDFVNKIRSKNKVGDNSQDFKATEEKPRITKRTKIKTIRSSTTEVSGSQLSHRRDFNIKKDSLILFKEKMLKKQPYEQNKDVECEPGTCDPNECKLEECLTRIKSLGVGNKWKRHTRHFGTGKKRSDVTVALRTKKKKVRDSQVQMESSKTTKTKSVSSNIIFPKQKSVTATELKAKIKSPTQKPKVTKNTYKPENPLKNTESFSVYSQTKPESKTKSSYSMTTILKSRKLSSISKLETKGHKSMSPKSRQEKTYKTTKSTGSMTSISKAKAKGQSVRKESKIASNKIKPSARLQIKVKEKPLDEKVLVQVSPKSNVICECIPSKKSSVGHKLDRHTLSKKASRSHKLDRPSLSKKASVGLKLDRRTLSKISSISHRLDGHKDKPKPFKNLVETELRQPSKSRSSVLENEKFIASVDAKSEKRMKSIHAMTKERSKKSKTHVIITSSKASQQSSASQASKTYLQNDMPFPSDCEPYICIPYECDPENCARILLAKSKTRSRSVRSSTERLKRKSKYIQSKSGVNLKKIPKHISSEPPIPSSKKIKGAINSHPQKQAVKISSSFSFDIEFSKEKSPVKVDEKEHFVTGHQKKIKQTDHRRKYKNHGTSNISVRHNLSSQSRSAQSLKNQVEHKLKRCICTLKLLQKKNKIKHAASKKTMASLKELKKRPEKKQTQTKPSEIDYMVSSGTSMEVNNQHAKNVAILVSKETNTIITPKKSKVCTCESASKSISRRIQSSENRNVRQMKRKKRYSRSPNIESKVSSDKSKRQAVRIGSNFSFNIEFSKTINNYQDIHEKEPLNQLISDKPIKKERRHLQEKEMKVFKPRVQHQASEITPSEKVKQTYTEPFLKRCICTLKLMKRNKKKVETLSPLQNNNIMHMPKKSITMNRAEISYNHERSNFVAHEYVSGLGILKCSNDSKKFLKLSQMNLHHKYSRDLVSRSRFNKTLKTIIPSNSRNTQYFTREIREKAKTNNHEYHKIHIIPSCSKQNNQFSKKKSNTDNFITNEDLRNEQDKFNMLRPQLHYANNESVEPDAKPKGKRSYLGSLVKKCFSAMKFQKKRNKANLENNNNVISENLKYSYPLSNFQMCGSKYTKKQLGKMPYNLSNYKIVQNFSIPEMCDPYECHKKTKQREMAGLHDHYISIDRHIRKSALSVSTSDFSVRRKTKSTQSTLLKLKSKDHVCVTNIQKTMKAVRSFSPSNQTVRKGIPNSFNKKNTKSRFEPDILDNINNINQNSVQRCNTVNELSTVKRVKEGYHYLPLVNNIRKDSKASNVGILLKRCFCTLGLQKKNLPKREFQRNQPIMTQFVQLEQNKKKNNRPNITKSEGRNVSNKKLNEGELLDLKLPNGSYLPKENVFENQNGTNNSYYDSPQQMLNKRYFSRRSHVRSQINVNFDKMRSLLNTQKLNPFYQSFYAMNVKVLHDSACHECDPQECSKKERTKWLRRSTTSTKRSLISDTASMKLDADCYKKCAELKRKTKSPKGPENPTLIGSDFSIRMAVYKDTDRHKNKNQLESKSTGLPHLIQKCFCKPKNETEESKLSQSTHDVKKSNKGGKKKTKSQKATECTCPKTEKYKKYRPCPYHQQQEEMRKRELTQTKRNSISYGSDVNVDIEFFKDRLQKHKANLSPEQALAKYNRIKGIGDGDVANEKRSAVDKFKRRCAFCSQKRGKMLTQKPSMETIGHESKKSKKLVTPIETQSEREIETLSTIMPYSKRKFRKVESQSRLSRDEKPINTKETFCKKKDKQVKFSLDQPDKKVKKSAVKKAKQKKGKGQNVCFKCRAGLENEHALGPQNNDFSKNTKGHPNMSGSRKMRKKGKPPPAPMDNTPLFDMTVNKTTMRIVNKDEVLQNLGSAGNETEAMKKARKSIRNRTMAKPEIEMIVDRGNANIINSDKVTKQIDYANLKRGIEPTQQQAEVKKQSKKSAKFGNKLTKEEKTHTNDCKCCVCTLNRQKGIAPAHFHGGQLALRHQKFRPCICGSVICQKDLEKLKQEQRSLANVKIKTCVCGSNICAEESSKMPELLLEASRQAEREKEMAKRARDKEKMYQQARKQRAKQRRKIDEKIWKLRRKEDKREMKHIKKAKTDGSVIMIAESLIDLGTFGSKAFCDIAKTLGRAISHPRDTVHNIRDMVYVPGHAAKSTKKMVKGMGLYSTLNRIQARLWKMPIIKAFVGKMEENAFSNYVVHIADKDPKKRMKKFKKKKVSERINFQCSLYMSSIRKRPCLRIYRMCPWFYPHCIGLLQAWKQLMDILLFILAVLVWSPCILCMEICRGFVCCCMCQG